MLTLFLGPRKPVWLNYSHLGAIFPRFLSNAEVCVIILSFFFLSSNPLPTLSSPPFLSIESLDSNGNEILTSPFLFLFLFFRSQEIFLRLLRHVFDTWLGWWWGGGGVWTRGSLFFTLQGPAERKKERKKDMERGGERRREEGKVERQILSMYLRA